MPTMDCTNFNTEIVELKKLSTDSTEMRFTNFLSRDAYYRLYEFTKIVELKNLSTDSSKLRFADFLSADFL